MIIVKNRQYMTVKSMAEWYESSPQTVRRNLAAIKACDRYKNATVTINDDGDMMINSLVYEDFLEFKPKLKHKNLAKTLPPYSAARIREQRGELRGYQQ